ncbi:hypothetical protein BGZ63DRAFT_1518 [Mariannaea sp. PMI_226]|nr:hypothetical protein BGZ63DRAFT_1518 [Mariannaea sp. PMI_226]
MEYGEPCFLLSRKVSHLLTDKSTYYRSIAILLGSFGLTGGGGCVKMNARLMINSPSSTSISTSISNSISNSISTSIHHHTHLHMDMQMHMQGKAGQVKSGPHTNCSLLLSALPPVSVTIANILTSQAAHHLPYIRLFLPPHDMLPHTSSCQPTRTHMHMHIHHTTVSKQINK